MKYLLCKFILLFFMLFISQQALTSVHSPPTFKINIFSLNNGKGLQQSRRILKSALEELGHIVNEKEFLTSFNTNEPVVDINIFFEVLIPEYYACARLNWFIPNPEWYSQPLALLKNIDLVLCRNRLVEHIFKPLVKETYFIGFSSQDYYQANTNKNFSCCLHLAGGSPYKGTNTIIKVWEEGLKPLLFLQVFPYYGQYPLESSIDWIIARLPENQLQSLQNYCGIHLCLSEVEGWGHYLVEGMSTGAVIITTDAPPMNEYITDKRCLVPYEKTIPCHLGTRYLVNPQAFASVLLDVLSLPEGELEEIGKKNRENYLKMTRAFEKRIAILLNSQMTYKIRGEPPTPPI